MSYKVIIQFPRIEGLSPINTYLHPGLWAIGDNELNGKMGNNNNFSVLEIITNHLVFHGFTNHLWLGKKILQTYKLAENLSYRKGISVNVKETNEEYSVEQLIRINDEPVLLYPGHILTNADLSKMMEFHTASDSLVTILVSKGVQYRVGLAKIDTKTGKIIEFREKPYDEKRSIYTGIVMLKKGWRPLLNSFLKEDWEPDTESRILRFHGYRSSIDIFIEYLIAHSSVNAFIMDGSKHKGKALDPWWINLSQLETWRKLDPKEIFKKMRHIIEF